MVTLQRVFAAEPAQRHAEQGRGIKPVNPGRAGQHRLAGLIAVEDQTGSGRRHRQQIGIGPHRAIGEVDLIGAVKAPEIDLVVAAINRQDPLVPRRIAKVANVDIGLVDRRIEFDDVSPGPAIVPQVQPIEAEPGRIADRIVACAGGYVIVSAAAGQHIVTVATVQIIVAGAAAQRVVAGVPVQDVPKRCAKIDVVSGRASEIAAGFGRRHGYQLGTGPHGAIGKPDLIDAHIRRLALTDVDGIVRDQRLQHQAAPIARGVDGNVGGREGGVEFDRLPTAGLARIPQVIGAEPDREAIDIGARAALQAIDTAATDQHIVAGSALEIILISAADQDIVKFAAAQCIVAGRADQRIDLWIAAIVVDPRWGCDHAQKIGVSPGSPVGKMNPDQPDWRSFKLLPFIDFNRVSGGNIAQDNAIVFQPITRADVLFDHDIGPVDRGIEFDPVGRSREHANRVAPESCGKTVGVGAAAAGQDVIAATAGQAVIAISAVELIIPAPAEQQIVAPAAIDRIVASGAINGVRQFDRRQVDCVDGLTERR